MKKNKNKNKLIEKTIKIIKTISKKLNGI